MATIRMMARSEVTRRLPFRCRDRFAVAVEDFAPDTGLGPRHAHDEGEGEGAWPRSFFGRKARKLVPEPTADPYEDEAYRLWAIKQQASPASGMISLIAVFVCG